MEKVRLEMEIATYLKDWEEDEEIGLHLSTDNGCIPIEIDDVRDLARHFAQWQKEQTEKRWLEDRDGCFWDGVEEGKKAMREQMLTEAVEGEVESFSDMNYPEVSIPLNPTMFKVGDKVHIIIVKEEEK